MQRFFFLISLTAFVVILNPYLMSYNNIQRIIIPRVNNFGIKKKICFIICHQHQTRSGKIKTNKTQQTSVKTQVFFVKTELRHI